MFEFADKTKKIKVINVTEARSNFAAILADTASHYIITKNNKPQRVIIGFEEFKKYQGNAISVSPQEPAVQAGASEDETAIAHKPKASPSVRGMIAAQFELSQQREKAPPEVPDNFTLENVEAVPKEEMLMPDEEGAVPAPAEKEELAVLPEPQEDDEAKESERDYFDSGAEDIGDLTDPLEPSVDAEDVRESVIRANREAIFQDDNELSSAPEETPAKTPVESEEEPATQRTPEEEAYFRRYRKLYEGYPPAFSGGEEDDVPDIVLPVPKTPKGHHDETEFGFAATTATGGEANFSPQAEEDLDMARPNEPAHDVDGCFTLRSEEDPQRTEETEATANPIKVKTDDGLPSLQELLRDLDKQRLTGEEPNPLDTRDIDDIINRITSD